MTAGPRLFLNSIQVPVAPTAGYVLTSDAAGVATWQPAASASDLTAFAFFVGG